METHMIIALLTSLAVMSYARVIQGPSFCRGLDCPLFNVTAKGKGFEVRAYEESAWVSTNVQDVDYDSAVEVGFDRLFKYISGANVKKMKIAMTCPVITRVIPGPGPACESNFTISFFVPFEYQKDPPAPSASDVEISYLSAENRIVSYFPGIAKQEDWIKQANELKETLNGTSYKFSTDFFYTAGYDSPFELFNRHNEIWFVETK